MVCAIWYGDPHPGEEPLVVQDATQRLAGVALWLYDLSMRAEPTTTGVLAALLAEMRAQHQSQVASEDVLHRLHRLLRANFAVNHHLPNLAALTGLSPTHLTRLYKARYGVTPMGDLRRIRLQAAMSMIRLRQGTIAEISRDCGLGRAGYLARLIRHQTGAAASALRRGKDSSADT